MCICVYVHVRVCKDKVETTLVPWGWELKRPFPNSSLLIEIYKLSLLRKTWLKELVSYHFGLPGLVNAPTNKGRACYTLCYTYMGMDMVVCEPMCTQRPRRKKRTHKDRVWKAVGLYGC